MNQEDKIDPTGPEEGEKSQEQDPICDDCGERHPPTPEMFKGIAQALSEAIEEKRRDEYQARQEFFSMAMASVGELAKAVMADPNGGKERAEKLREALLTLAGMSATSHQDDLSEDLGGFTHPLQ